MKRASSLAPGTARLRALVDVAASTLDAVAGAEHVASLLAAAIRSGLGDEATVWLKHPSNQQLTSAASSHPYQVVEELAVIVRDEFGDDATDLHEPRNFTALEYRAGDDAAAWLGGYGLSGAALVPVLSGERLIGVVSLTRDDDREPLTDEDVQYVQALADIAGNTLSTARVLSDSALVMEELRQQADLMEFMSDALVACDVERRIVSWNAGAEHIYGYTRAEAVGCDLFALLATQFFASDGVPAEVDDVLSEVHGSGTWRGELRERRADGAPLTIMSSLTARLDHEHLPSGLVVVNRDVTDQRREEHRALHDALTGLPNRRMLNHRLYDSFARACRNNWSLAVLFIDLDGFKPINDTYGHAAGDEVLKATATRLANLVRRTDTVARLGGDEFVVVLEDAGTIHDISHIADRLVETVAAPIEIGSTTVVVRPSIGITVAEGSEGLETTPEQLLEKADEAMYVAKRQRLGIWLSPA